MTITFDGYDLVSMLVPDDPTPMQGPVSIPRKSEPSSTFPLTGSSCSRQLPDVREGFQIDLRRIPTFLVGSYRTKNTSSVDAFSDASAQGLAETEVNAAFAPPLIRAKL